MFRLKTLYISSNLLNALPEWLGQLTQLEELNIAANQLTELPEWLGQLTQLQRLDVASNQLTTLPKSLRNLSSLQELYLDGNPQLNLPDDVLGPPIIDVYHGKKTPALPTEILNYYFRTRGGARALNEGKLILVGRGGVGKTSLVKRLIDNDFDKDSAKTEGININQWTVPGCDPSVRLHVWDFGGQEIMHATHQFFLTKRSLYVLVLSGREGTEDYDVEYWLKLIGSFGADSPVIVVMNKIEEHPFELNRQSLQQKYPQILYFEQTDCATGRGIASLRKKICAGIEQMPDVRALFPASWFSIKERLSGMTENFLSMAAYRSICKGLGEEDRKAQEDLTGYLHCLGIALHYKDDMRLKDTSVLNPRWVTNGIYTLLNAPRLHEQGGHLNIADIADLLAAGDYPPEKHAFLLELMRKFELCYELTDTGGQRYLIPELLPKEEPSLAGWDDGDCLRFQYHYTILPEGLLPRFIVRTHEMSAGQAQWRTGVVLRYEQNEALVKVDVQDRKTFITVRGNRAGRRRMLAIIRNHFDAIHNSIARLEVVERVPVQGNAKATVAYRHLLRLEEQNETQYLPENAETHINVIDILNGYETATERQKRRQQENMPGMQYIYNIKAESVHIKGDEMNNREMHINGSTFTNSPVALEQTLTNCYNTVQQIENAELQQKVTELLHQIEDLLPQLDATAAGEAKDAVETLTKEIAKEAPRQKWFELSAQGIIEAANTVQAMAPAILATLNSLSLAVFGVPFRL